MWKQVAYHQQTTPHSDKRYYGAWWNLNVTAGRISLDGSITCPYPIIPDNVKDYGEELWQKDLEKCQKQVQEPIFQRTILLSMINRYRLFYGTEQSILEFAVETPWTYLPMPTYAERWGKGFLTCPKPDLAVGFRRQKSFQDCDWNS